MHAGRKGDFMDILKDASFDAVVVGSGPGGAAVTHELSRHGKRVLVLEKGSGDPIRGTILQSASMALIPGRSLLFTPQLLALIRGIVYGGGSILYYACAFDPPYEMFDARGIDLRPYVDRLQRELPMAPLSDDLMGPAAARILESAQALGYPWRRLPKLVYQERCRPGCNKCTMGCPYGAKWTARNYIDEALRNGSSLMTGVHVNRVATHAGSAGSVEFTHKGRTRHVTAPVIVLAAGGIGTPLILRNSGIREAGRDFFFDPLLAALGETDDNRYGGEFPMAAGYQDVGEGYILTDLVWPRWIFSVFAAEVLRFHRWPAHGRILPIMVKVRDGLGGRLTARGGVRKRLHAADREKLLRGYQHARRILNHAGARHIFKTWFTATHPGGTAKIGDVVDRHLKTRRDGLYVCDASVIPEPWGLPPTLTLLALGTRLGGRLAATWRA